MVRLGQGRGRLEQHQRWVGMERGLVAGKCRVLGKVLSKSKEADCAFKWLFGEVPFLTRGRQPPRRSGHHPNGEVRG